MEQTNPAALAIALIMGDFVEVEDKHAEAVAVIRESLPQELSEEDKDRIANEVATMVLEDVDATGDTGKSQRTN